MDISQQISPGYLSSATLVSAGFETNHFRQEYLSHRTLYQAQPLDVAFFLESQAQALMDAILQKRSRVRVQLPDYIKVSRTPQEEPRLRTVPANSRTLGIGRLVNRLTQANLITLVSQRIAELEGSPNLAIATAAGLLRFCSVNYLLHDVLPTGQPVLYEAAEGEELPSYPVAWNLERDRAREAARRSPVRQTFPGEVNLADNESCVPDTQRFYLPQWVAFDCSGNLLVSSQRKAETHVAFMQRFLSIIHMASAFAPYIVVDQEYQSKRYGMLGQLVNQGRALAKYDMEAIIHLIRQRASAHDLNRGFSLSVPYFDDQALEMKTYQFEVVPPGRLEFISAFVVIATRHAQVKVAQDIGLSPSTRKYLLMNLRVLENAFFVPDRKWNR